MSSILSLDLSSSGNDDYAIDVRDSAVQWINDIEADSKYRRWSPSLMDLLKPTFPGMLRSIRRNLYNLVGITFLTIYFIKVKKKIVFFEYTVMLIFYERSIKFTFSRYGIIIESIISLVDYNVDQLLIDGKFQCYALLLFIMEN